MARRRKITVHFTHREGSDPQQAMQAVENVFRPSIIHVDVQPKGSIESAIPCPDEQLETSVREHAADLLDQRDQQLKASPPKERPPADSKRVVRDAREWAVRLAKNGFRLTVKIIPHIEKLTNIASRLLELLGDT